MARYTAETADHYGSGGLTGFFQLKNDKDWAQVRFMYDSMVDLEDNACLSVHEVEVDGKKRYVNCLREYNAPVSDCPLCEAGYKVNAKVFLHLWDEATQEIKTWDRGKAFLSKLSSLSARYQPLVATPFEIERNGKAGDQKTTYETYARETDGLTLEDLPQPEPILGTLVLDKTWEELDAYVTRGTFPSDNAQQNRGVSNARPQPQRQSAPPARQSTPARQQAPQQPQRGATPPQRQAPQQGHPNPSHAAPQSNRLAGRQQLANEANKKVINDDDDIPF